jgi:hypothetical protein
MAVGIRHADHVAPSYQQKLALTSPTSGGNSVGIVRSRTEATELFSYYYYYYYYYYYISIHYLTRQKRLCCGAMSGSSPLPLHQGERSQF